MVRLLKYLQYIPAAWAVIKVIWTMYKSKVKADGYREALRDEQHKRVRAEARIELDARLNDTDAERIARLRREAEDDNGI